MTVKYITILFMMFSLLAGGCATLNESECRNADWRMIGMEDGTRGKLLSYIGRHRSACSKYDITPDLDAYTEGHAEGVKMYCTRQKGFEVGREGIQYNGVCPPHLEEIFLEGYRIGNEFYIIDCNIGRLSSSIHHDRRKIKEIKEKIAGQEKLLVNPQSSEQQRSNLLKEIRAFEGEIGRLGAEIIECERGKAVEEFKLEQLNQMYGY